MATMQHPFPPPPPLPHVSAAMAGPNPRPHLYLQPRRGRAAPTTPSPSVAPHLPETTARLLDAALLDPKHPPAQAKPKLFPRAAFPILNLAPTTYVPASFPVYSLESTLAPVPQNCNASSSRARWVNASIGAILRSPNVQAGTWRPTIPSTPPPPSLSRPLRNTRYGVVPLIQRPHR